MRYEHPIDRLAYLARPAILVVLWAAGPIMLFSYGKMILMVLDQWPWWASAPTITSHLLGILGFASLFDQREEARMSPKDGQV